MRRRLLTLGWSLRSVRVHLLRFPPLMGRSRHLKKPDKLGRLMCPAAVDADDITQLVDLAGRLEHSQAAAA